jgi:hypothetical protein
MFHKVPARVWAIVLVGLALSACTASDSSLSPSATTAFCQPGICVGSTPDSTPTSILEMMP